MYIHLNNINLKLKTVHGDSGCCFKCHLHSLLPPPPPPPQKKSNIIFVPNYCLINVLYPWLKDCVSFHTRCVCPFLFLFPFDRFCQTPLQTHWWTLFISEVGFYMNCFRLLSWIGCSRPRVVVNAAALVRCVTLRTCDKRPWERFFYLFSKYKRIYFIMLDNINDMTFQMCLKWQKHIHIFNYLIKMIDRDSLVVAGYWYGHVPSAPPPPPPPNSTPL